MNEISKALVTGANGFIGSNLCQLLRERGIPVVGLIYPHSRTEYLQALEVELYSFDITKEIPEQIFEGVSHVFHLAAIASDWGDWDTHYNIHVKALNNILYWSVKKKVNRFIQVSTLAIHQFNGHRETGEEVKKKSTINNYAITKGIAEELVSSYKDHIHVSIVRPGIVPYGPWDLTTTPRLLKALDYRYYFHIRSGRTLVCLSYVENLVEGMLLVAQGPQASGQVYNLVDDTVTWRQYTESLAKVFDKPLPKSSLPYWLAIALAYTLNFLYRFLRLSSPPPLTPYRVSLFKDDLAFSSEKAKRELNYQPRYGLDEGLERTRLWFDRNYFH